MDRNLALEFVRVTEAAAIAASAYIGAGDKNAADQAAVTAMRSAFNSIEFDGEVVIGEGEMDEAPMLFIGEKVGSGKGLAVDIACDPLEGTTITAKGGPEAIAVIAAGEKGTLLKAPDMYMDKIAIGPAGRGVIDITKSPTWNLEAASKALKKDIRDMMIMILDRDRHSELIKEVRAAGARICLISDGDVSSVVATSYEESGIDMMFGSGGAPEGVIAAAALQCLGGDMQGRLIFENKEQIERAARMGISDPNKIYGLDDLAKGNVMFVATGVTRGSLLQGVRTTVGAAHTHSIVMRAETGTVRTIHARHQFDRKPRYGW